MDIALPCMVGVVVAIGVSVFARVVGLDRDRAFYPVVLIIVTTYYVLFALVEGSTRALLLESIGVVGFGLIAVIGFKRNLWLVAAGLAAHGVFDFFHGHLIANPGLPAWWPPWCMSYDITAAACLAWLQRKSSR